MSDNTPIMVAPEKFDYVVDVFTQRGACPPDTTLRKCPGPSEVDEQECVDCWSRWLTTSP